MVFVYVVTFYMLTAFTIYVKENLKPWIEINHSDGLYLYLLLILWIFAFFLRGNTIAWLCKHIRKT